MTNELIFATQIFSIISFISALFILYRVLVNQKDSTIELLKEKNTFLKEQLSNLQEISPDKLTKSLSERIHILQEELERLSKDQEKNKQVIQQKEKELQNIQEQLEEIQSIASEYFCPHCKAPMVEREYHDESTEWGDINHEYTSFECGLTFTDGKETYPCKNKNK